MGNVRGGRCKWCIKMGEVWHDERRAGISEFIYRETDRIQRSDPALADMLFTPRLHWTATRIDTMTGNAQVVVVEKVGHYFSFVFFVGCCALRLHAIVGREASGWVCGGQKGKGKEWVLIAEGRCTGPQGTRRRRSKSEENRCGRGGASKQLWWLWKVIWW